MNKVFSYSFPQMLSAYADYKKNKIEYYNGDRRILGMTISVFMLVFLLNLALMIVAIVLLATNAPYMPIWAIVLAVVFLILFAFGPIVTIILALFARK